MVGRKLGEILVEMGALDAYEAQAGASHAQLRGIPVGQALVELELCDEETVLRALARQLGAPIVQLANVRIATDVLALVPARFAFAHRVLPVQRVRNHGGRDTLVVAITHPKNAALDELAFVTGCRISPVIVATEALETALRRQYGAAPAVGGRVFLGNGPGIDHVVESYFDELQLAVSAHASHP